MKNVLLQRYLDWNLQEICEEFSTVFFVEQQHQAKKNNDIFETDKLKM